MSRLKDRVNNTSLFSIIAFTASFILFAFLLHINQIPALIADIIISTLIGYITSRIVNKIKEKSAIKKAKAEAEKKKLEDDVSRYYSDEVNAILKESNTAISEMARIYSSINDTSIKTKINEIMRLTDKIARDAISDPSDIPAIKKFFNYYLPTTIKLLNTYDRMGSQNIEGENINKSMKSIDDMLDTAIEAYRKHLDSLFENQAIDIETDIEVMNTLMAREGLTGTKDF